MVKMFSKCSVTTGKFPELCSWCAFEYFDRLYDLTHKFNEILGFVRRSELTQGTDLEEITSQLAALDIDGESKSPSY